MFSLAFANKKHMKTIATEIREFLDQTGLPQSRLSAESGVPASTLCNLLKGKRQHLLGPNQDNIRAAMSRLSLTAAPSTPSEPEEEALV